MTINQLDYCILDLRANASTNVPSVRDSPGRHASVNVGLFKGSTLLGTFPLPPPATTHVDLVNMISFVGQLPTSYDSGVILDPLQIESYGATMLLSPDELLYATICLVGALTNPNLGLPHDVEPN